MNAKLTPASAGIRPQSPPSLPLSVNYSACDEAGTPHAHLLECCAPVPGAAAPLPTGGHCEIASAARLVSASATEWLPHQLERVIVAVPRGRCITLDVTRKAR